MKQGEDRRDAKNNYKKKTRGKKILRKKGPKEKTRKVGIKAKKEALKTRKHTHKKSKGENQKDDDREGKTHRRSNQHKKNSLLTKGKKGQINSTVNRQGTLKRFEKGN